MEVNQLQKHQYHRFQKENTRGILKDRNQSDINEDNPNKVSLISFDGGKDHKITSPNSKRSSVTEDGNFLGDVTAQSNDAVSYDLSAATTTAAQGTTGKPASLLATLVEKNQLIAQESQKRLKEREREFEERISRLEMGHMQEVEKLKAEIMVLKQFDALQKEIESQHLREQQVATKDKNVKKQEQRQKMEDWKEKRLMKVRELLIGELQRIQCLASQNESILQSRVSELEAKLDEKTKLLSELIERAGTFEQQFRASQEEWEKKERDYLEVIGDKQRRFHNELKKYEVELEYEKEQKRAPITVTAFTPDQQQQPINSNVSNLNAQVENVVKDFNEFKKLSDLQKEALQDRLQQVFLEKENYVLQMQQRVKHFETKSIRLEQQNSKLREELGEYMHSAQEKMYTLERQREETKRENVALGEGFRDEVKGFVEEVIKKFETTKENIQEVSAKANYQLEQLQVFFQNDIQLKKGTEQELLIEQLQVENQAMREEQKNIMEQVFYQKLFRELKSQASPLVRGGVLLSKTQFDESLSKLKSLVEAWARERQEEGNRLVALQKKLAEVSEAANLKDKTDSETIVELTNKLQDSQFELRKIQNSDLMGISPTLTSLVENKVLKSRCDQLFLQNKELSDQMQAIQQSYSKIDQELQKLIKRPEKSKVDELALKDLEIQRLRSEMQSLQQSRSKLEEHYQHKVDSLVGECQQRQEKVDELWVRFCRLNEIYKKKEGQGVQEWQVRQKAVLNELKVLQQERKEFVKQEERNKFFKELQEVLGQSSREFKELSVSHSQQFQQEYEEQLKVMKFEVDSVTTQRNMLADRLEKSEFQYQQVLAQKKQVIHEFDASVQKVNDLTNQRVNEIKQQNQLLQEVQLMITTQQESQMEKIKEIIEELIGEKEQLTRAQFEARQAHNLVEYYEEIERKNADLAQENALLQAQYKLLEERVVHLEEELNVKNLLFYQEKEILEKMLKQVQRFAESRGLEESRLEKSLTFNSNVESLLSKIQNATHIKDVKRFFREVQKAILYEKEIIQIERRFTKLIRQEREERLQMQNQHLKKVLDSLVLKIEVLNFRQKELGVLSPKEVSEIKQILNDIKRLETFTNAKLAEENNRLTQILTNSTPFGHGHELNELLRRSRRASLDKSIINFTGVEGGKLCLKIASKQHQSVMLTAHDQSRLMGQSQSVRMTPRTSCSKLKKKKKLAKSVGKRNELKIY